MQNPLFLHPSDNPLSLSVTKLEGASDYRSWKRSMEIQLSSKRKLGFVNGTELRSTSDTTEAIQWDTCNSMVTSWIHNNVSDSIKKSVLFITSAYEVWKQLEKRFQLTHGSRKYKLSKELFGLKQNGVNIVDYYTALSSLWEELESINLLPAISTVTDDVTAFLKALTTQKEEAKLFQFLNGLDDNYTSQRSQLLMLTPLPSVEMACSAIQQEESQRDILKTSFPYDNDMSAMFSKTSFNNNKAVPCGVCGGKWHTSDKCWNIIGYPKGHYKYKAKPSTGQNPKSRSNFTPTNPSQRQSNQRQFSQGGPDVAQVSLTPDGNDSQQSIVFSPQQLHQLLQLIPNTSESTTEDAMESPFSGMITCNNVHTNSNVWIMDTGATDHMTSNLEILANVKPANAHMTVNLPNGAKAVVSHVGDVLLKNGLKLINVLYVPAFTHNLLPIHKLSRDNNYYAMFSPNSCSIVETGTHKVKSEGTVSNGLYHMCNSMSPNLNLQCLAVSKASLSEQYTLWHNRLGHAPASKLKYIDCIKHCAGVTEQICLTCPMAKFTKLPFSASDSYAAKAFELIHTNIWGPYRVCTRQKFRYFLTIVDDHTRMTWIYLLEHKSEYLKTLKTFYNFVEKQFGASIQQVRSDNAREFKDATCQLFFQSQGIVHQTSCNYRPQQNARVEREHRHLLEVARALMFQSGLQVSFWGESVLTAAYIINRLPSSVLDNKCPYELLYKMPVDYDELKTFGCLAFAINPVHSNDKLTARGVPCVFVGYPPTQRGYRLLDLKSMKTFVSRDVSFNEGVFPLNSTTPKPYMHPLPTHMPNTSIPSYVNDDLFVTVHPNEPPMTPQHHASPTSSDRSQSPPSVTSQTSTPQNYQTPPRRSTRIHKPPSWMESYVTQPPPNPSANVVTVTTQHVEPIFECFISSLIAQTDPVTFKQAVKDENWVNAMNVELDALECNNTWDITPLPPTKKSIGCK